MEILEAFLWIVIVMFIVVTIISIAFYLLKYLSLAYVGKICNVDNSFTVLIPFYNWYKEGEILEKAVGTGEVKESWLGHPYISENIKLKIFISNLITKLIGVGSYGTLITTFMEIESFELQTDTFKLITNIIIAFITIYLILIKAYVLRCQNSPLVLSIIIPFIIPSFYALILYFTIKEKMQKQTNYNNQDNENVGKNVFYEEQETKYNNINKDYNDVYYDSNTNENNDYQDNINNDNNLNFNNDYKF